METFRDVVCPFCGLGCDDLTVEAGPGGLAVTSTRCPVARERFAAVSAAPPEPPRVDGADTTPEAAVRAAAALLAGSRAPLVAGLGADVDGVRAALTLAERLGAVVDHEHSDALYRTLAVFQRTGWFATTLAELRNRCDLLLVAGRDPAALHPRFYERWVAPPPAYRRPADRAVVFLSGEPLPETRTVLDGIPVTVLPEPPERAGAVAAALAAALADPDAAGAPFGGLAGRVRAAGYVVVAWAAGGMDGPHADLTVERLVALVTAVNAHTRGAGLPLGGADNVIGANQVCTWRFGVPLRLSLAGGAARHDPHRFAWTRAAATADAVLWVSAFRTGMPALPSAPPVVVLAPPGTRFAAEPAVFIPVGTPGVDHAAHLFRGDSVVALRAGRLLDRGLPDAARVLAAIAGALPPGEAAAC